MDSQVREIVNGGLLAHTMHKKVSIIGIVNNVDPNGTSFEIRTVDNITITVNLSSPLDDMLEGYVEVHGVSESRNVIKADEYIQFTQQQSEDFDVEGHNKLCALLQQYPEAFQTC